MSKQAASAHPSVPALQAEVQRLQAALQSTEAAAHRQYDLLDALFVRSPAAISLTRLSDGSFVDVNARWLQITGFTRQEVLGRTPHELGMGAADAAQDDWGSWLRNMGAGKLALALTTRDGRHVRFEMQGAHIHVLGEPHAVVHLQDTTLEHQALQAVEASERVLQERLDAFQRLTSRLPEMVFQWVHGKGDARGRFVFASDAVQRIFGVSPEQARESADAVFARVHEHDRVDVLYALQRSTQHGQTWAQEFRVRAPDGRPRVVYGRAVTYLEASGHTVAYGSISDVTEHRAAQEQLRESEARFRALTELSSDLYWEQDTEFRFVRIHGELVPVWGQSSLGKTLWDVGVLNMDESAWDAHRTALRLHRPFRELELESLDAKGQVYWISISGAPIVDSMGQFRGYRGIGRNITERKYAEAQIERLAFFDVLTGLPNRRLLLDRLHKALASSQRDKTPGALLFIDLDNFKDLNDTQGHDVGDLLLQQVAQRLLACVRETDTVARLGGDEFVVMLQNLDAAREQASVQVEQVGKKILAVLNQPYVLGGVDHHSTPSLGVALFEGDEQTMDELLKQADLAMYEAKAAGRNTIRFFDPTMQALVAKRTALEVDLRYGLSRYELVLYYQPVVDVDGRMMGVEALVRWRHPRRGLVSPAEFIPVAEQTGLILPLGQWVLETACQQLAAWATQGARAALTMAVNVSARQFKQPDFVQQVLGLLRKTGANPARLKLELTESLLLSDTQDAIRKMTELQAAGVGFSLDDFGTGYSSLSYLKLLPLQQLKIDQSFVRDVLSDPNDAAIARTILALGQSLGFQVVAEGVETVGQHEFLLLNGCTLFQGYLFGRPVPVDSLVLPSAEADAPALA